MKMAETGFGKLADSIPNEDCYSLKDVAAELGLGTQRAAQLIKQAIDARKVQKLMKKDGVKILYAPQMVDQLKKIYQNGEITKPRQRKGLGLSSALKHAELVITVPVFDKDEAKLLINKFGTEDNIKKYVQEKLSEIYKPVKAQLAEIEARHKQEIEAILRKF